MYEIPWNSHIAMLPFTYQLLTGVQRIVLWTPLGHCDPVREGKPVKTLVLQFRGLPVADSMQHASRGVAAFAA